MLEVHAGAVLLGGEAHFDLGRRIPLRRLPREDDPRRRDARRHEPHLELLAVREALEEPSALAALEEDVRGPLPPKEKTSLRGHHFPALKANPATCFRIAGKAEKRRRRFSAAC
jgi:hypothetical protein